MTERLLLRPVEAAEAMGVSRAKAYQLIAEGQIPSIRVGGSIRVPVHALHEWVQRQMEKAVVAAA